jgi:hypothetical protein
MDQSTDVELQAGPSEAGGVVLNIGEGVGAAVVRTPASLLGSEIEIRRRQDAWAGRHVAVRQRLLPSGAICAALFDSLDEGQYELRVRHGSPESPTVLLEVEGGRVADVALDLLPPRGLS